MQENKYITWIAHAHLYKNKKVIENYNEEIQILVHPKHPRVCLNLGQENIVEQVAKLPKSIQLYFYSCVWMNFALKDDTDSDFLIDFILLPILEYCEINSIYSTADMVWDNHAISDRACVFLQLSKMPKLSLIKVKIENHLNLIKQNLNIILNSKKWASNNHRVFHLCAAYCLAKFFTKNKQKEKFYLSELELFIKSLIDIPTGLSVEQSISYYYFDIQLCQLVLNFIRDTGNNLSFSIEDITSNQDRHLQSLAFPDGMLPASGDTPFDFKRHIDLSPDEQVFYWKNLERLGHYRGCSPNKKFHYHLLSHNAESAHGHKSPLHLDLWVEGIGMIFVDSGGPYRYGDKLRYSWFMAQKAHNTINFLYPNNANEKSQIIVKNKQDHLMALYTQINSFLVRKLQSANNFFCINDLINAGTNWELNFHLSPSVSLEQMDTNTFKIIGEGKQLSMVFELPSDVNLGLYKSYLTTGTGQKQLTTSLEISGGEGIFDITCRIIILE